MKKCYVCGENHEAETKVCPPCLKIKRDKYLKSVGGVLTKKHQDLTGERFGDYLVERVCEKGRFKRKTYVCLCKCGKITFAEARNLIRFPFKKCPHQVFPVDTDAVMQ
jgi:hypothetical protein